MPAHGTATTVFHLAHSGQLQRPVPLSLAVAGDGQQQRLPIRLAPVLLNGNFEYTPVEDGKPEFWFVHDYSGKLQARHLDRLVGLDPEIVYDGRYSLRIDACTGSVSGAKVDVHAPRLNVERNAVTAPAPSFALPREDGPMSSPAASMAG